MQLITLYLYPGCASVDHQGISPWACQVTNQHLLLCIITMLSAALDASDTSKTNGSGLLEIIREHMRGQCDRKYTSPKRR